MKKFIYLFAASLVAFSFASCEPNKPSRPSDDDDDPKPKKVKIQLAVNVESPTEATWTVTPSDTSVWYWGELISLEWIENNLSSTIEGIPEGNIAWYNSKNYDFNDLLTFSEPLVHKGEWTGESKELNPHDEYILYVYPIDTFLNAKGDIVYQTFTTMPEGYVDLGLPSGTLWKKESESVQWNTYDKVISEYGDAVPSQVEWEELINNCTWTYNADQGAYIIQGKNGNTISMACAGYRDCSEGRHYKQTEGWYWTSTATDEDKAYAAFFTHYETYDNITTDEMPKCNGFSVHLIYPVEPEMW